MLKLDRYPGLSQIIHNIGWLILDKIVRLGLGIFLFAIVARHFGPDLFGKFSYGVSFATIGFTIVSLGLPSIVVREILYKPESTNTILGTAATMHFISGVIIFLFTSGLVVWIRPDDNLIKVIVVILSSAAMFKFSDIVLYWFESKVESKYIVLIQNIVFIAFSIIKISMIYFGISIIAFAWITLLESGVTALFLFVMMMYRGYNFGDLSISTARAKTLLQDSLPFMLSGISITIYMKMDQIMLGYLVNDKAVGLYSAGSRISEVWYFIPTTIAISVLPLLIEARQKSEEEYYANLQIIFDLLALVGLIMGLVITVFAESIIKTLYGISYLESAAVLSITIWASLFVSLGVASSNWFIIENRPILALQRTTGAAVVNIILNLLLIPKLGLKGAAFALLLSQATASFFFDYFQSKTRRIFFMKLKGLNVLRKEHTLRSMLRRISEK